MEPAQGPTPEDLLKRREGFLVGAVVGASLTGRATGSRHAPTALADALLVELAGGGVDLRRLAGRWVDWQRVDGAGIDPILTLALHHLRDFDAPIADLPSGNVAALAAVLPAALASASPRAMIAGAFHVARLLDPLESTALGAMAIVLAAAAFMAGRRDFVPDVVAALRANDASAELIEAVRTIPRDPRTSPPVPIGANPGPPSVVTWVLWQAYHRPRGFDAMHELACAPDVSASVGALVGALFGARDGTESWPAEWLTRAGEDVVLRAVLARRLGQI